MGSLAELVGVTTHNRQSHINRCIASGPRPNSQQPKHKIMGGHTNPSLDRVLPGGLIVKTNRADSENQLAKSAPGRQNRPIESATERTAP